MKIVVITGSAHKNGTSAHLAEKFISGAVDGGHEVFRFDAAFKKVAPCVGCDKCHEEEHLKNQVNTSCVFKDDMQELDPQLLEADVIAFVSPIYYYDINAQLKAVIDRFYANDPSLHNNKKAVMLLTMADDTRASADGALSSFRGMTNFLGWTIAGSVVAMNCCTLEMLKNSPYPKQAYDLGRGLS